MTASIHIVIAGSGPAGTATAIGLKRLGFDVCVISSPRQFVACEGISDRVLQGLHNAGIRHAIEAIALPSQRIASWNGSTNQANTERLVKRDQFDQALLKDLSDHDISIVYGRVDRVKNGNSTITIEGRDNRGEPFSLIANFFVDARGRSAPGAKQARLRGPETVSLLQRWQGEPCDAQSAAASFEEGWAWMARFTDGSRYTQLTLAADAIPAKSQLDDFFFERLEPLKEAEDFYHDAEKVGELKARSATAILTCDPIDERTMRIGDAALAVDPLSGNGIFQSLSTALLAPSVIHTILCKQDNAELARQFYRERINHAFMRFARMGRDFYQQESRWLELPFWQQRQAWPDQQPMHEPVAPSELKVERRPVVDNHFIENHEVIVTPDQPLGIWHLNGILLAPVVSSLQEQPLVSEESISDRLNALGVAESKQALLTAWLQQQKIINVNH